MKLLVDLGNSRVKWATLEGGRLGPQQAMAHEGWAVGDWQRTLFDVPGIDEVVAASVAGGPAAAALAEAARAATGQDPTFVATSAEAAGVRNAYPEPRLLGVDRWLAVIAAYRRVGGPCCVADIGTAATIDGVSADGRHLGGYIVPGPELMTRSLWRGTADLASRTAGSGASGGAPFADNTRDAIERGGRLAIAALVDRVAADLERHESRRPALILTGGAAPLVAPLLATPAERVTDLVLRGLAVLVAARIG